MIVKVIFAIVLVGLSADLIATQGLYLVFFIFVKIDLIRSIKIYPCFKSASMRTSGHYKGSANGTSYARTGGLWRRDVQHMAQASDKCLTRLSAIVPRTKSYPLTDSANCTGSVWSWNRCHPLADGMRCRVGLGNI